jgi:hypothetical protein
MRRQKPWGEYCSCPPIPHWDEQNHRQRLWLRYAWTAITAFAIALAAWVFLERLQCTCQLAKSRLIVASVEAGSDNTVGTVPGASDSDAGRIETYVLARLETMKPGDPLNRAILERIIDSSPLRTTDPTTKHSVISAILVNAAAVTGKLGGLAVDLAGKTIAQKANIFDKLVDAGIDLARDLTVEAGKKGLEKLLGEKDSKKVNLSESQSNVQICMVPAYTPPKPGGNPPHGRTNKPSGACKA